MGEVPVGKGRVILCGSFLGNAFVENQSPDFSRFVAWCCRKVKPQGLRIIPPACSQAGEPGYVRIGQAGGHRIAFVFLPPGVSRAELAVEDDFSPELALTDLLTGKKYSPSKESPMTLDIQTGKNGIAVLAGIQLPEPANVRLERIKPIHTHDSLA